MLTSHHSELKVLKLPPTGSSVPGSGTCPFDAVVVLRRQLDTWHVYAKSGATGHLEFMQPEL